MRYLVTVLSTVVSQEKESKHDGDAGGDDLKPKVASVICCRAKIKTRFTTHQSIMSRTPTVTTPAFYLRHDLGIVTRFNTNPILIRSQEQLAELRGDNCQAARAHSITD